MSSVVFTHHTWWKMPLIYLGNVFTSPICHLTIEVTFDKLYTLLFHEFIPTYSEHTAYYEHVDKIRYIRDIPYFPDSLRDAIKLMRVRDQTDTRQYTGYSSPCNLSSTRRELNDRLARQIGEAYDGNELFNGLSEIFTKIKTEHEKKQIESSDACDATLSELKNAYERIHLVESVSDNILNQKNVLQQSLENSLQKNEKLADDLKTSEETIAELRKINERLVILIDAEKLKKSSLSKKLSDITDLYKNLLSSTICKQVQ